MINRLLWTVRLWLGVRLVGSSYPKNDLNALLVKLERDLPEPTKQPERAWFANIRAKLQNLHSEADSYGLSADFLRLLLREAATIAGLDLQLLQVNIDVKEKTLPTYTPEALRGGYGKDFSTDLQLRHWAVPLIAENLGRYLLEEGGPNYLEVPFTSSRNPEQVVFVMRLERVDGKPASQIIYELKQQVDELEAELEHCLEHCKERECYCDQDDQPWT